MGRGLNSRGIAYSCPPQPTAKTSEVFLLERLCSGLEQPQSVVCDCAHKTGNGHRLLRSWSEAQSRCSECVEHWVSSSYCRG